MNVARASRFGAPPLAAASAFFSLMTWGLPSRAAELPCSVAAAKAAAPPGMTIGAIGDLNPQLPAAPTGVVRVEAQGTTPAYCLVTGSVITRKRTGKTANFGLALPLSWNRRFLFSGCDGYCGVVFQTLPDATGGAYPSDALARGYAITATDDGHESAPIGYPSDASWALDAPGVPDTDAITDYFHRAVHVVTRASKVFVESWYARDIDRSYFFGCGGGGRESMMEAARHPDDFDGYIAGAPLFDVPGQVLAGRGSQALLEPDAYIPPALMRLVNDVIYSACDALDGVRDRLIQNPGRCSFRPERLLCKGDNGVACLTRSQVRTLRTWFSAATDGTGRIVSYGLPVSDIYDPGAPGDNLFRSLVAAGPLEYPRSKAPWGPWAPEQPNAWAFMDQAVRHLVHRDPDFVLSASPLVDRRGVISDETLELLVERTDGGSSDTSARLGPFIAGNRKLIMYHGYSDGWISPYRTLRFYRTWAERAGGYDVLRDDARLFMLPGMYHCSRGPGPNVFDALGALEQWVEQGVAPETMVATKYENDDVRQRILRTMPLCSFPTQASYLGEGDVNDAARWTCASNAQLLRSGSNGLEAGLVGRVR